MDKYSSELKIQIFINANINTVCSMHHALCSSDMKVNMKATRNQNIYVTYYLFAFCLIFWPYSINLMYAQTNFFYTLFESSFQQNTATCMSVHAF